MKASGATATVALPLPFPSSCLPLAWSFAAVLVSVSPAKVKSRWEPVSTAVPLSFRGWVMAGFWRLVSRAMVNLADDLSA